MLSHPETTALTWPQANLNPGGLSITGPGWSLKTLVGSCVAVMVWDEARHLAGMCHYVLAQRVSSCPEEQVPTALDGRYGVEALQILGERMGLLLNEGPPPLVHVVGGAALLVGPGAPAHSIGRSNIELALAWVERLGLRLGQVWVGGGSGRRIEFNTSTGELRVCPVSEPAQHPGLSLSSIGASA